MPLNYAKLPHPLHYDLKYIHKKMYSNLRCVTL